MLAAELILATTGVLEPEPPDATDLAAADGLQDAWPARIREWVAGKGTRRYTLPTKQSTANLRAQLEKPLTDTQERDAVGVLATSDPALGGEYLASLKAARAYLAKLYPRVEIASPLAGVEELPPPPDRAASWKCVVMAVHDPDRIFDELEMASLERAQAQAFKDVYPEARQLVLNAMYDELRAMFLRGVRMLPLDRLAMIRTLGLLKPDAPILPEERPPAEAPDQAEAPDLRAQEKQAPQERVTSPLR